MHDGDGHDWRLVPLAGAAWVGAWLGTAALRPPSGAWAATACAAGFCTWLLWRRGLSWAVIALVVLMVTGGSALAREWQLHESTPARWAAAEGHGVARLSVSSDPRLITGTGRPDMVVLEATLMRLQVRGEVVVTRQAITVFGTGEVAERLALAPVGASLELSGRLRAADPTSSTALAIRASAVGTWSLPPGPLAALVNAMRAGLRDAASHSPPLQAALLPSLTVGDTSAVPRSLEDQFRATSLSHLMAVSGANLTLMLLVVLWGARMVGVRGVWVRVVGVACTGLFVVLCRGEPSVVRAAAMGLVGLAAIGVGAGRGSLRALALAVLALMLLDPWLARSWGFALSVAACGGLVLWSARWTALLSLWLPRGLAEAAAAPLAAQLATQPLITAMSSQVSLVGVFANMAAAPFVGPVTVLGLVASCLVWCPPVATAIAWVAGWGIQPIIWVAQAGAGLPAATVNWPAGALGVLLVTVACALLVTLFDRILSRPRAVLLCIALTLAGLLVRPVPLGWPGPWQAVFCDVGQGDTTVLRASASAAVVVDTGPEPGAAQRCLDSLAIDDVPLLILTHFHADHVEGAPELIRRYRPRLVLLGGVASPEGAVRAVEEAAAAVGSELRRAVPGETIGAGAVTWTTISVWSQTPAIADGVAENNGSVVGVADVSGLRVLLAGDVEPDGQRRALRQAGELGASLGVHVLKLPHHGSPNQLEEFLAASNARVAVASAGLDNDYGHPSAKTLRMVQLLGMTTLRTDQQGAIAIHVVGGTLRVRVSGGRSDQ